LDTTREANIRRLTKVERRSRLAQDPRDNRRDPLAPHTASVEYGGKPKPGRAHGHRQESLLSPAGKGSLTRQKTYRQ